MSYMTLTMFSADSLASTEHAETLYAILSAWEFPPSAYGEYEPIQTNWQDKNGFVQAWEKQSRRHFGQVLVRRKGRFGYLADSILQFGPRVGYHGISVYQIKESECTHSCLRSIVELGDNIFEGLHMDYGFACSSDEYETKNILMNVTHEDGTMEPRKVVGMNWPHCLPGIYWTNYFGRRYLEKGFGSNLREAGWDRLVPIGDGIRIQTSDGPRGFEDEQALLRENALMKALGANWFFNNVNEGFCDSIDAPSDDLRKPMLSS